MIFLEELAKRVWGAKGTDVRILRRILWAGLVFFHKYFDVHRLDEDNVEVMGTVCLLLAGKAEDGVKSIKTLIDATHELQRRGQAIVVGETVRVRAMPASEPRASGGRRKRRRKAGWVVESVVTSGVEGATARGHYIDERTGTRTDVERPFTDLERLLDMKSRPYNELKEKILDGERRLLNALAFDVEVETAHKAAIRLIREAIDLPGQHEQKKLAQFSFDFINDSLFTNVYLQFSPHAIAFAAVCLAWQREDDPAAAAGAAPTRAGTAQSLPMPRAAALGAAASDAADAGGSSSGGGSSSSGSSSSSSGGSTLEAWQRGFKLEPAFVPPGHIMHIARAIAAGSVLRFAHGGSERRELEAVMERLLARLRAALVARSGGTDFAGIALDEHGEYAARWGSAAPPAPKRARASPAATT
jgi:hypothetical protein